MSLSPDSSKPRHFLSLLIPVRDEDPYLIEFINYYLIHGVDHFYFYDNDSKVPVVDVVREYRDRCTVMRAPGDAVQSRAYEHFCKHLEEFCAREGISSRRTWVTALPVKCIATLECAEEHLKLVRDRLRPRRAERVG